MKSPEERAEAILLFARTMPHRSRFVRNVATQIREAEQAATERAAGIAEKSLRAHCLRQYELSPNFVLD